MAAVRRASSRNCVWVFRSCRPDCHSLPPARKPFRGKLEVFAGQAMTGTQDLVSDVGASLAEQGRQQARTVDWNELVVMGGDQQHRDAAQIGQGSWIKRQHRTQQ